jgi:hypothetical protein
VKQYKQSLCPDTFSGFVANYDAKSHIDEIKEATEFLHNVVIPEYAKDVNTNGCHSDTKNLKYALHRRGINLYFMGELRQLVTDALFKKYILVVRTHLVSMAMTHIH